MRRGTDIRHSVVIDARPIDPCGPLGRRGQLERALSSIVMYGPLVLLFGCILAFGGTVEWAIFAMRTAAAGLVMAWAGLQIVRGNFRVSSNPLYFPILAVLLIAVIQLSARTTAYSYATEFELLQYIAYFAIFFVVSESWQDKNHRQIILYTLAAFGFALAVFAITQGFTSKDKLYWMVTPQHGGAVYGPYVNRNHYAGIMELLTPVPFVLAAVRNRSLEQRALLIFTGVVMGVSIITSQSRAGMVSFAIEMIVLGLILSRARTFRKIGPGLFAGIFLFGALVLWFGGGELFSRFIGLSDSLRLSVAHDSRAMIFQRSFLGWGFGTFPQIYPHFRTFYTNLFVNQAHNDVLQFVIESGLIGTLAAAWFMIALYRKALPAVAGWSSSMKDAGTLAAFIGCAGLLFHSLFDFNLHIPANAAAFFIFCALATCGQTRSSRDSVS